MGIRWSQQHGNTSRFSVSLRFEDDPDSGTNADRDMAVSWGSFQIWVRGQNLCAHLDGGEESKSVHWYLLPLMEWLTSSWTPLLHEEKLPGRNAADDAWESLIRTATAPSLLDEDSIRRLESGWYQWRQRHSLQVSRDGGLFPDIVLRRWRDRVEISWGEAKIAGAPEGFRFTVARGVERLSPQDVALPLFETLRGAARFLAEERPTSPRLRRLREDIDRLQTTDSDARLAWLVGLGRTREEMSRSWAKIKHGLARVPDAPQALWSSLRGNLVAEGSCHVALMFGSAAPTLEHDEVMALARCVVQRYEPEGRSEARSLRKLVREEPLEDGTGAYQQGYQLAERTLEDLAIDAERVVPIDRVLATLGIEVAEERLRDRAVRAVSIAGSKHRPLILVNPLHPFNATPGGRRFTLAHELCHILFDRASGRELALISGPWAPRAIERRANAFGAMLLMPTALVRRAIAGLTQPEDCGESIREIANRCATSVTATLEHVADLQMWDEATRERVRAEISGP